jgi:hypothetical protein
MKIKLLFILLFIGSILNATTVETTKEIYAPQEQIKVNFSEMIGDVKDWIGIYSVGSSNIWANVLRWEWTGGVSNGTITLDNLPNGNYEVRAFFEDSFNLEASYIFLVEGDALDVDINTTKSNYLLNEEIEVNFNHMLGDAKDWIGIYSVDANNSWENVLRWKYTAGFLSGTLLLEGLPLGEYELRAFFQDSFNLELSYAFSVESEEDNDSVVLTSNKDSYVPNELIFVNFDNMQGSTTDWIGIYPEGASYEFENVIEWRYTGGTVDGNSSFNGLLAGTYDIRAFFNNSLTKQATKTITVLDLQSTSTLYEDAEAGSNPNWIHVAGQYPMTRITPGFESLGAVRFKAYWTQGGTYNPTEFQLPFNNGGNSIEKVLEIDMRARSNPHFNFGLIVQTKEGRRIIIWDSFYNHNGAGRTVIEPFISHSNGNTILNNPAPDDYHYFGSRNIFRHYKINVENTIRHLEPDNELIRIDSFVTTGGEYDNIKLSSH